MKTVHTTKQFQCELCEFTCSRKDNLNRHIDSHTKTKSQVTKEKLQTLLQMRRKEQNFIWMMISLTQMMRIKFSMKHTISIIRKETR